MSDYDVGWVSITCGHCGKQADWDRWISTATGPLPHGVYQCPHCRYAFKRQSTGNKSWDKIALVPVQGQL